MINTGITNWNKAYPEKGKKPILTMPLPVELFCLYHIIQRQRALPARMVLPAN
jgi:hypothetical protein